MTWTWKHHLLTEIAMSFIGIAWAVVGALVEILIGDLPASWACLISGASIVYVGTVFDDLFKEHLDPHRIGFDPSMVRMTERWK